MIRIRKTPVLALLAALLIFSACQTSNEPKPLYQSDAFALFPNRVEQDSLSVTALSDSTLDGASSVALKNDISMYPQFTSSSVLMNAVYNLSLDALAQNLQTERSHSNLSSRTSIQARDMSYSVWLSLAQLEPERAKTALMKQVVNNRIVPHTSWPVYADHIVWAMAAWEVYKFTGDQVWLQQAYSVIQNTVSTDQAILPDPKTGLLHGTTSALDGCANYPSWMNAADLSASQSLSVNAAYVRVYQILAEMGTLLRQPEAWTQKADTLQQAINQHLWNEEQGYYVQGIYGRDNKTTAPQSDALGEALTVLYGIATDDRAMDVLKNTPVLELGIPCTYPLASQAGVPLVEAACPYAHVLWTLAGAKLQHSKVVQHGLASGLRQSAFLLTQKPSDAQTTFSVGNATGQLALFYHVLFGLEAQTDKLTFAPVVPRSFRGIYKLTNFKYRNVLLNITVSGYGTNIKSFKVNGEEKTDFEIAANQSGTFTIEMVLNNHDSRKPINLVEAFAVPTTPSLTLSDTTLTWTSTSDAVFYEVYRNGMLLQTSSDTILHLAPDTEPTEYQAVATNQEKNESYRSNPIFSAPFTHVFVIEPERFVRKSAKARSGFNGLGYIELKDGDTTSIHLDVTMQKAGLYRLTVRYATNEGATTSGICKFSANESQAQVLVMPAQTLQTWENTSPVYIQLDEGRNRIRIQQLVGSSQRANAPMLLIDQLMLVLMSKPDTPKNEEAKAAR